MDTGRYIKAKPQMFRVGDLIKAQCSVVFMKSRGTGIRIKVVLCTLALVNCEYSMVSEFPLRGKDTN